MRREDAVKRLNELAAVEGADVEIEHQEADDILIAVLIEADMEDVANAWLGCRKAIGFWYA